jgi:hypothetical protein
MPRGLGWDAPAHPTQMFVTQKVKHRDPTGQTTKLSSVHATDPLRSHSNVSMHLRLALDLGRQAQIQSKMQGTLLHVTHWFATPARYVRLQCSLRCQCVAVRGSACQCWQCVPVLAERASVLCGRRVAGSPAARRGLGAGGGCDSCLPPAQGEPLGVPLAGSQAASCAGGELCAGDPAAVRASSELECHISRMLRPILHPSPDH